MKVYFFLLLIISFHLAHAEPYRRLVNFEWEPIEEAKSYEIEIRKKGTSKKPNAFISVKPEWNGRLPVGKYEFRLRSLDARKVPGDWSGYAELDVNLEPVKMKYPPANAMIPSTKDNDAKIKFEWLGVPVANEYQLIIMNEKNEVVVDKKTKYLSLDV